MSCDTYIYTEYKLSDLENDRRKAVINFKKKYFWVLEKNAWKEYGSCYGHKQDFNYLKNKCKKRYHNLRWGSLNNQNTIELIIDNSVENSCCCIYYGGKYYRSIDCYNGKRTFIENKWNENGFPLTSEVEYIYDFVSSGNSLFRITDYPENILTSYDETIDFIKRYESYDLNRFREGYEPDYALIKEHWDKFPNSIITFG
jgi:hypothetical protein